MTTLRPPRLSRSPVLRFHLLLRHRYVRPPLTPNTVPEKYQGLALVPLNEPGAPNDWLNYDVVVSNASGNATSTAVPISTADIAFFGGITLDGPAGAKYRFEYLADISNTNSWTLLMNIVHPGGRQFYIDTTSPGTQRRFFRAVPTP